MIHVLICKKKFDDACARIRCLDESCAKLAKDNDHARVVLDELKASRVLLSTCDTCPSLQSKLDEARITIGKLEKSRLSE